MTDIYSDARKIISRAITSLEAAEDSASADQQLVLLDLIEALRTERKQIDLYQLTYSSSTYVPLTESIIEAKQMLDDLTQEIKQLIEQAEQAAQILGALAELVALASRVVA